MISDIYTQNDVELFDKLSKMPDSSYIVPIVHPSFSLRDKGFYQHATYTYCERLRSHYHALIFRDKKL